MSRAGVMRCPVASWPIAFVAFMLHVMTSRLSTTEHATEPENAARTEYTMRAERTARPEEGSRRGRRRRWRRLRPRRANSSLGQGVHHCSDQPGIRRDAVLRRLLVHARLDRRRQPQADPGERLVLIRLPQITR